MTFNNQSPFITDFYQLSMLQAYFEEGMDKIAVFEFFVRPMVERNFYIAAGLEQVIEYVLNLKFSEDDLSYLQTTNYFSPSFLTSLKQLKFTGDIYAMPEGSIFFPNEPILQVIAPLAQAQFIESRVINLLNLQTMISSKAIRNVLQAEDKMLIDFGMRRAHGSEAALYSSRANYLAGFHGTSLVLAAQLFNIPTFGTMAHSYVQAHESEKQAFLAFAKSQPNNVVLLIDTYDIEQATTTVIEIVPILKKEDIYIKAVRIDSGDLHENAVLVRNLLDKANLKNIKIFVSGDLDEFTLQALAKKKSPIDAYGIGTKLDTSADKPYLNCAYKLEEYANKPRRKFSEGKATYPGRKQVFRSVDKHYDVIGLAYEVIEEAQPLLMPIIKNGLRIQSETLDQIRERVKKQISWLPEKLKTLQAVDVPYQVLLSEALKKIL